MSGNKLHLIHLFGLTLAALMLSACGGGSEESDEGSIAVDGNVPIAYVWDDLDILPPA